MGLFKTTNRVALLSFCIFSTSLSDSVIAKDDAEEFSIELEKFVLDKKMVSDIYVFEKLGFNGEYIPTVMIFGYPNNKGACDYILRYAVIDNPNLEFRCRKID